MHSDVPSTKRAKRGSYFAGGGKRRAVYELNISSSVPAKLL